MSYVWFFRTSLSIYDKNSEYIPLPRVTALIIVFVMYRPSMNRIMPTYRKNTLKITFQTSSLSYTQIPVSWSTGFPCNVVNRSQKDVGFETTPPPPPKLTEGTEIPLPPITGTETAPVPEPMALTSASWGATVATEIELIEFIIWKENYKLWKIQIENRSSMENKILKVSLKILKVIKASIFWDNKCNNVICVIDI